METLIILPTILIGIVFFVLISWFMDTITTKHKNKKEKILKIIILSMCIFLCIFIEIMIIKGIKNYSPEPTAIDVYRGLTELEIRTVNGVPKDTVVVFKKIDNK